MLLSLLFASLALVCCVDSVGYWDIQLSPQSIKTVPFAGSHITVWEHARSRGRFYAMPLVYLLPDSATTAINLLTNEYEMTFDVLMWSVEAKEAVYRYLKSNVNASVAKDHVEMLPMEKIRIAWTRSSQNIAYKLADHWQPNTHLPAQVSFQFTCKSEQACNRLGTAMKRNPKMFAALLELRYVINGHRSARRILTVTSRHLMRGRLFAQLNNMPHAPDDVRYVSMEDLKTITTESLLNVIASVVKDNRYVDNGDEADAEDHLQHELQKQEVSTKNFSPETWNSVFWDPQWARPDKLTGYLNKVLSNDSSDSGNFLLDESQGAMNGSASASHLGFTVTGNNAASQSKVRKENVRSILRERHSHIEWTGTKFELKPMKLYRLNLAVLNSSSKIVSSNVQVHYFETVHNIKLRLTDPNLTASLTPQLVQARLMEKLDLLNSSTSDQLQRKVAQLTAAGDRINSSVRSFVRSFVRSSVRSSVRALDQRMEQRLSAVNRELATLPGWPTTSRYCILANGKCPSGFNRYSRSAKKLDLTWFSSSDDSACGSLGSSSIYCGGGYMNIYIVICCRY